jgi:hypothetical protein
VITRRIYMLVPTRSQAEEVVRELSGRGVNQRHIHTLARDGVDTARLPRANIRQRTELGAHLERWLWDMNLVLFFAAAALLFLAAWYAAWGWAVGCLLFMAVSFLLGDRFASHVPHLHVEDCRVPLKHGEILLLVDVPRWRVNEVETAVRLRFPEVDISGVSWTLDALGI